MSGILDNKTRVLDVVLTNEGRRRLSQGEDVAAYYSFSDGGTFYLPDLTSGSADASIRLQIEAFSSPFDVMVPVTDIDGNISFFQTEYGSVISGRVKDDITSPSISTQIAGGLPTTSYELLNASSITAIKKQQIIGSFDEDITSGEFLISPDYESFKFNANNQLNDNLKTQNINSIPAIFYDKHFASSLSYKYLPPTFNGMVLGNYENLSDVETPTFQQIVGDTIDAAVQNGNFMSFTFDQTSLDNNLLCQVFETNGSIMNKLLFVDGGEQMIDGKMQKVFFAGKSFLNDSGMQIFTRIFTFLFSN